MSFTPYYIIGALFVECYFIAVALLLRAYSVGLINCPYRNPPIPAAKIMKIGFTPIAQMSSAERIGIQQLVHDTFALNAIFHVGTAIKATTAGRIPLNIDSTTGLS